MCFNQQHNEDYALYLLSPESCHYCDILVLFSNLSLDTAGFFAMRKGIHPMRHLVRHVFPDGSSVMTVMAWQRPYPGLDITTKFHDVDRLNGTVDPEAAAASKPDSQRSRFKNRFNLLPKDVGVTKK